MQSLYRLSIIGAAWIWWQEFVLKTRHCSSRQNTVSSRCNCTQGILHELSTSFWSRPQVSETSYCARTLQKLLKCLGRDSYLKHSNHGCRWIPNRSDEVFRRERSTTSGMATIIMTLHGIWMLAAMEELAIGCWRQRDWLEAAHRRCSLVS